MRALAVVGLVSLACASSSEPSPPAAPQAEAKALVSDDPPLPFLAWCREACGRRNAKRAVAIQMIEAECTGGCVASWRAPEARDLAALTRLDGQRARLVGVLEGTTLRLSDGTTVTVGPGLGEPPLGAGEVAVVGLVAGRELKDHEVIAPTGR